MKVNKATVSLFISIFCLGQYCPAVFCQVKSGSSDGAFVSAADNGLILRGIESGTPFTNKSTLQGTPLETNPGAIPGADAVMTPDLLLVSPLSKGTAAPPAPLSTFIGESLILKVEDKDIVLDHLQGVMISIVNDTSRPLVMDGDNAKATSDEKTYDCVSLIALQKSVMPRHDAKIMTAEVFTKLIPAAVSVGFVPTIKDAKQIHKPVRLRYGPDERRRLVEASRFGKRILWPHQKTEGVVYFQEMKNLAGSRIEMPVHTLFDAPDSTVLSGVM